MNKSTRRLVNLVAVTSIIGLLVLGLLVSPAGAGGLPSAPSDPVNAAWRRAQRSGSYRFSTTIVETTYPAPSVTNVGSRSREQRVYFEGRTDLPARTLEFALWQQGGSLTDTRDAVEVRIEGDAAYGRETGGTWQEIENFSGAFAPGNDLMAYLVGARNVRKVETTDSLDRAPSDRRPVRYDVRGGQVTAHPGPGGLYTLYAFDLNGAELATFIRDQLEDQLRAEGSLPLGITLDTSDQFRDVVGGGYVWIDGDGLPRRLTIEIAYPQQQNGERVKAEIATDFSGYDRRQLARAATPSSRLAEALGIPTSAGAWRELRRQAGLALGTLCALGLVITRRRSRAVYTTFILVLVGAMILTPLLHSHQVAAFNAEVAAERVAAGEREEHAEQTREINASLPGSDWRPHLSADNQTGEFAASPDAHEVAGLEHAQPATRIWTAEEATPEPDSDDDGDGLTYLHEERLGTDPDEADTDGDQITDDVEVAGFRFAGRTWYTDPLNPDTNNDGLLDGVECPEQARENENVLSESQACRDSDGDGDPDIFDRDNDDDGVPDRVDLSPFSTMDNQGAPFDADTPLLLQVDELEADRPVFVDFQLRPENEEHLWYAFNVLDWPSGDEEAQIQRKSGNDSTFADVAEEDAELTANADNGDMRLIPMLEVEIPYKDGHYGNLPVKEGAPAQRTADLELDDWLDTSKLAPYGIAVRPMNDDGDLVAYVPLNLVQDETGGDRVAFSARMHYWPAPSGNGGSIADWGLTQQVRVVWLVHMLTDYRDEDGEWVLDVPQIVRAYPESWTLTGLAVREDHGLDVAITYEDPEGDEHLDYDDPLWGVARGLEASFAVGRDEDGDGERDVTVAEIDARFSLTSTSTITARFGISPEIGIETNTYAYDHEDFVTHIMMTETKKVLSDTFTSYVDLGADAVTLLFSRESRARTGNLDGDGDMVMIEKNRLTMRLAQDSAPLEVATYLNWGPFRYDEDSDAWESYPVAEYLDKLEVRLKDVLDEYKDEDNYEEILAGQILIAKAYYITLYQGQRNLVQLGPDLTGPQDPAQSDEELVAWLMGMTIEESGGLIARQVFALARQFKRVGLGSIALGKHILAKDVFAQIGRAFKNGWRNFSQTWNQFSGLKRGLAAGGVIIAVAAVVTLFITAFAFFDGGEAWLYLINGLAVVMATLDIVVIGFNLVHRGTQTITQALKNLKVLKMGTKAGVLGLIIAVFLIWGVFAWQIRTNGVKAGSLAFNAALATTIAVSITAVILLAITAIPLVGQIIAALIFLIDAITMFACSASDSDHWFCDYGISGLIAAGITWIIYSANVMIDVEDEDRLNITEFEQDFVDPDKGLSAGSSIAYRATLENEIELIAWKDTNYDWKAGAYWWQYSDKTLRSSTFDYALQDDTSGIHSGLDRGDIRSDWEDAAGDRVRFVDHAETEVTLEQAGINQNINLYLIEGYALPVQECWAFPIFIPFTLLIPVCYVRTERGSGDINLGKSLYYDVFPDTLDGFYDLTIVDGGYALGWSPGTDPSFPRLRDADGDGLLVYRDDGADPDDGDWDTDDDGLSDYFEHEQGIDPRDVDSDDDGLSDREEAILGTSPLRTDTDYDGLTDKEEVDGWEFVYDFREDGSQIRTWVTADPLSSDPDGDTLTDFQEKLFGFHPRVSSDPNVLTLESEIREAKAPQLLLRFSEPAGANAFRDDSGYANNGSCRGGACPISGHEGRYGNAPHFDGVGDFIRADSVCSDISGAGAYTFGAWFYPRGGMANDAIILAFSTAGGDNVVHLGFNPAGNTVYAASPDQRVESSAVGLDQWHHAAVAVDESGTAGLYVNGNQVGTFEASVRAAADGRFSIGQEWDGNTASDFFLGFIDEVLVFDHALSAGEIQEMKDGRYNPEDRTVRPGDTLDYEARVKNELFNRYAQGLLSTSFPAAFSEVAPEAFILNPQEETVLRGSVAVDGTAASGVYSLTQEVDALITDWREASDYAELLYHFAETAPPFEDSSGSQPPRDGDCSGTSCPTSTTGRYGNGLQFDGVDDYVTNDNVARYLAGDAFTFGAWVYLTADSGAGAVVGFKTAGGRNRNTILFSADDGKFSHWNGRTQLASTTETYSTDTWHHVMVVIEDDDDATLYVNGEPAATFETAVRPDPDGTFSIGQEPANVMFGESFKGKIDEVVVFNRALTAEEIQAYFGDPVLALTLDETAGATSFEDASPFRNDAVCAGGHCPQPGEAGVNSRAVLFEGDNYITVPDNQALSLAEGSFTLSTWIYPEGANDTLSDCPFRAEYFDNSFLANNENTIRRCENWPIDHNWGRGRIVSPDPDHEFYNYASARWTGTFFFEEGEHTFAFEHDDGMRVWLDNDQLLNDWDEGHRSQTASRQIESGLHTVKVEYKEASGSALAKVSWSPSPLPLPQGIIGAQSDPGGQDYPAIQRLGDRVRIVLNEETAYLSPPGVLSIDAWHHVAATFDGTTLILYVDGTEVGQLAAAGQTPAGGTGLDVGRTARAKELTVESVSVLETGDTNQGGDWPAELVLELRQDGGGWQTVWTQDGIWAEEEYNVAVTRTFGDYATLRMTESDAGEYQFCFGGCGGEDPEDEAMGTHTVEATRVSAYESVTRFDSEDYPRDRADLLWSASAEAAPFEGKIDEVRVYKQTFGPNEVEDLYDAGTQVLRLSLDDPPGSTEFTDELDQVTGICDGSQCPTAGLPGRDNWALSFDGENDVVTFDEANTAPLQDLTVAAWVKLDAMPAGETMRFVTLKDEKAVLRYDGSEGPGQLHFYMTIGGRLHHLRADNVLEPDAWTHVAGTYDSSTIRLYVNGQEIANLPVSGDVGDGNVVELSSAGETLDGMLDNVAIMRRALSAGEIASLANDVPQLILTLDEPTATTQFADDSGNGNTATCTGASCPTAGVKGQLGLAANFDGEDDVIQLAHDTTLMPTDEMTLIAWVKATDPDVDQKLVGKSSIGDGYVLGLKDGQLYPEIWDSSGARHWAQWGRVNPETWTFLAVTWETGGEMIGYINGEVAGRIDVGSNNIGTNADDLVVGAAPWDVAQYPVNGRVDHVLLYRRALSEQEMRALFRLQAKWVEERQSTDITVDADLPASALISDDVYRPKADVMLLVSTEDETTPVVLMEMKVDHSGDSTGWVAAPRCEGRGTTLQGDEMWCPTFEPTAGEGRYEVELRATDNVGNRELPSQTYEFLVDDTPPVPGTAHQNGELIRASERPNATWLVPLAGTVSDPQLAGTTSPGSGVRDVQVQLTATAHPTDTLLPHTADIAGESWTIDYPVPYADATGTYTLAVQTTDQVGNVRDFVSLITIGLDTSEPVANLAGSNTMTVPITSTLTLTGRVTETGVLSTGIEGVRVGFIPMAQVAMSQTVAIFHLDEPLTARTFAGKGGGVATCEAGFCPEAGAPGVWSTALSFDGGAYAAAHAVSSAITDTDGFSFGGWVYPQSGGGNYPGVISFNTADGSTSTNMIQFNNANWRFCYAEGDVGGTGAFRRCGGTYVPTETWYHVMVVIDEAGSGTLYVDGHEDLTFRTASRPDPEGSLFLGQIGQAWIGDEPSRFFTGRLDEVTVYNRALPPEEVLSLYTDATLDSTGDGVIASNWQIDVPAGLDGLYQINLRPEDRFANNPDGDWDAWNGEIDTQAPRVEVVAEEEVSYLSIRTTYTCRATDFNLVYRSEEHPAYDFVCPCQDLAPAATVYTPTYYHEVSPWYADAFTDTNRLYSLEASCTIVGPDVHDTTTRACDLHGRCTTAVADPASEIVNQPLIDSAVLTPTLNTVITSLAPVTLEGTAYAQDHLKTLTLFVDAVPVETFTWSSLGVTRTDWITTWTPTFEGTHLLTTQATDWNDQTQAEERKTQVVVDVTYPTITVDPLVLTATHRLSQDRVALTGLANDTNGVSDVEVRTDDGETQTAWQGAALHGSEWQLDWHLGEEPAGKPYTVTARATDAAGHTTWMTETVIVDLETPNPITLTLQSGGEVITPSTTLRTSPSLLELSWITETTQADLLGYTVRWTVYTTRTEAFGTIVPASGPLSSTYLAGEARRVRPQVISRMDTGNNQSDVYGTITVDSPVTPDYISLETLPGEHRPYLGWMESGCTQLGVDRRVARNAPGSAAIDDQQQLYVTWDSEALRMAWTGANWNYAGDLFIYLDTSAGGAAEATHVGGSAGAVPVSIALVPDLNYGADAAIWVEDAQTAHLLIWDSTTQDWTSRRLSPDYFQFEPGYNGGHTDLYLPFDILGINDPETSPLALVAYATETDAETEEPTGELWATMPPGNPVSSDRVVATDVFATEEEIVFGLTQAYLWPALAPGVCPNAPYGDTDVQLGLSVEPLGTAYSFLNDDLFWLWADLFDENRPIDVSKVMSFLDVDHPPVGDGDTITYTLRYANHGTEHATGVRLYAAGQGALRFGGATTTTVTIGDIAPGATGAVSFTGEIDTSAAYADCTAGGGTVITCTQGIRWANLGVIVVDPIAGTDITLPLDTLWANHEVDVEAPVFFGIEQPQRYISAGENVFQGYAFDVSGVPSLALQTLLDTTVCQDPTPFDGRWSCGWNATLANGGTPPSDGQVFDLQLVATDGYGQSSPTSASWSFVVDSVSPDVAYDGATRTAYSNTLVSETSLTFSGLITDNHGVGRVEVCLDGRCGPASLQAPGRASAVVTDVATTPATVLGCGGGELVRTFTVTDSFTVGRVELGVTIDHERRSDIVAVLTSPDSTTVQVLGPPVGTASEAGNYDVLLYDGAGTGLHELWVSDDTAPPHYDRSSRPYAPLDAFRGGSAAGTWTLTICDSDPVTKTGTYRSSRLTLVPDDTAATSGAWSYSPPKLGEIDGEARTVAATGYDLVGNQSTAISLTFVADNVAPALQVTEREELMRLMPDRSGTRVISGTVTDGSTALDRAVHMYAFVKPPASATGSARNLQVSRQGDVWWLELSPAAGGRYTIWINAADSAGNVTTVGPYYVTVVQLTATADSPALPAASTTLTATLRGADSQDYTFEWDPGDDSSSLTGAVVDHTYSALGTYTATVTATQGTHLFTATTQVRVVEAITGLAAANDGPTTLGEVTALTATVTTGGAVDYTWDLGDGTLTNGGVAYHTYGATGTYAAIVTATQGAQVFTATTEVRVVAPITGVTAVNDSPTALGTATALTATVSPSGAVDGVDYTWDLGDGAFAGGSSIRHTYGTVGAYTATVTATQGIEVFTATTRVEVLEAITGLTAVNDSPTALGEATILTATVAGGGDVIYTWHLGDGTLAGGSVVQHVYPTDGFYAAVVTATNKVSTMSATTQVIVGDVDIARTYMPLVFRSSRGATSREIYLPLLIRSNDNR